MSLPAPPRASRRSGRIAASLTFGAAALTIVAWSRSMFAAACFGVLTLLFGGLAVGDVYGWSRAAVVAAMIVGILPFVVLALAVVWILPTMG